MDDMDNEVSDMVNSFYDPKVEEKGKQEEKRSVAKIMLLEGENVEMIKKVYRAF